MHLFGGETINMKRVYSKFNRSLNSATTTMMAMRNVVVVWLLLAFSTLVVASQSERQQRLWETLLEVGGNRNLPLLSDIYVSAMEYGAECLTIIASIVGCSLGANYGGLD